MQPSEAFPLLETAQFIDVRKGFEYAAGHVPGATHMTLPDVPVRCGELDASRPVVVTCQIGQRSGLAADFLRERGFDAHNLEGGVEEWVEQGGALVAGDGGPGRVVDGVAEQLEL